jgi:hypothetical protein
MKIKEILNEALKDISTENKVYHRTSVPILYHILSSGKLSSSFYPSNTYNEINKEKIPHKQKEIATARKSTFSALDKNFGNKEQLSSNIGYIEFEIYKDRVKTLRNVKIKPIAELPREAERYMMQKLVPIYGEYRNSKKVLLQLMNSYKNKLFDEDSFEEYASDYLDLNKDYFNINDLKILKKHFFNYQKFIKEREGEERIQTNEGIPLNPNYMKIRILDSFKNELPKNWDLPKQFANLIKKNKDLFVQDKNYNDLLKLLSTY